MPPTDTLTERDRARALARELHHLGYTWQEIADLVGWCREWTRRQYSEAAR